MNAWFDARLESCRLTLKELGRQLDELAAEASAKPEDRLVPRHPASTATASKPRAVFFHKRIARNVVVVIDLSNEFKTISVTSDAEAVIGQLLRKGELTLSDRLLYRDSEGAWDEIPFQFYDEGTILPLQFSICNQAASLDALLKKIGLSFDLSL